jgi:RNA polymerase sigma-70 factor (ECF subfamily)
MQRLTREQQHVLALRFSQGFSVEETAKLMNKTIGAVKVLQFRALATMRTLLTGEKKR